MEIRSLVHALWHAAVGAVYMLMAYVLHFCTYQQLLLLL